MNPVIGVFNLFCVALMIGLYLARQRGDWRRRVDVTLGVVNLAGAYFNLLA